MVSNGEEPTGSPNASAVVTGPGYVRQWKDLPIKEDATRATINPVLLATACSGSSKQLTFLLEREDAGRPPIMMPTREFLSIVAGSSTDDDDVEEGIDQPDLPAAAPLLQGITTLGDTALHAVASHGDGQEFLECADIIYKRAKHLLFEQNKKGDTPLHRAARAGKSRMVSLLIKLATKEGKEDTDHRKERKHKLLREVNEGQETALHDAVRNGDEKMVEKLMEADPELANYPKDQGISPLYLAILLHQYSIAETLHSKSNGNLSYSGPNGQNALHIAILRDADITVKILKWKKNLTTQWDKDGSTPLHFAASLRTPGYLRRRQHFMAVFKANPAALYQADNNGLFPIHVAASVGGTSATRFFLGSVYNPFYVDTRSTIRWFLQHHPDSAGLCDAKGRTFLHVAVEKEMWPVVMFVCRTQSLAWILNMQDNDGNTALHLAVRAAELRIFRALFANKKVNLNLTNKDGETPLNLSRSKLPRGMGYAMNSESEIYNALLSVGASQGALRWDKTEEKYNLRPKLDDEDKESVKVKDTTEMFSIGSVLIATVAFGVTFALPGGYRADDHTNGGTPTFAGRYTFDAFMMANTLAFICSSIATVGFVFSGTSFINLGMRKTYLGISAFLMGSSVTSMSAAFALGVYLTLAPVARNTALAVCVMVPLVVLFPSMEALLKLSLLAWPLCMRKGYRGMVLVFSRALRIACTALWPFIVIFGWASFARRFFHQH